MKYELVVIIVTSHKSCKTKQILQKSYIKENLYFHSYKTRTFNIISYKTKQTSELEINCN